MLFVKAQILPIDEPAENLKVGPVNNLLYSMFNQIDIFLNQKLASPPNNDYPYRAYIESLVYSSAAKQSHLTASLWYDDSAECMEGAPENQGAGSNNGLKQRQYFTKGAKAFDMIGQLHCDLFNQDKMLINGVEMRVRLVRSKDAFYLMDSTNDGRFGIKIKEATLIVRRVKINPGILTAHANTLAKATAKYPITRVEVKTFTLHTGILGDSIDNAILGQLPNHIIIGFVDNRAFNGNRALNPLNFQHFDINYLSLYIDGVQVPSKALQPYFTGNAPSYIEIFKTLYTGTGIHFLNEGLGINRYNYAAGYFLTAFDLIPDLSAHCNSQWNLVHSGSVRIELGFETAPTLTINCIVYAVYDNILEIDSTRQILTDFSASVLEQKTPVVRPPPPTRQPMLCCHMWRCCTCKKKVGIHALCSLLASLTRLTSLFLLLAYARTSLALASHNGLHNRYSRFPRFGKKVSTQGSSYHMSTTKN